MAVNIGGASLTAATPVDLITAGSSGWTGVVYFENTAATAAVIELGRGSVTTVILAAQKYLDGQTIAAGAKGSFGPIVLDGTTEKFLVVESDTTGVVVTADGHDE